MAARGVRLCGGGRYLDRIRGSARDSKRPVEDCGPGVRQLFIDVAGRVAPCSFTVDELGMAVEDVETVPSLAGRFSATRQRRCPTVCGDCHSTEFFGKFQTR